MPNSSQLRSSASTSSRERVSWISWAVGVPSVGTLWSAVASVLSGRRTRRPARRRPSNAWRESTSWASQIFSNRLLATGLLTSSQACRDHRDEAGIGRSIVLEMVRQVGVKRHAVALVELVELTVDEQP